MRGEDCKNLVRRQYPPSRGVWNVRTGNDFHDACGDINELTDTVSAHIDLCVDAVIPTKKMFIYPNNKAMGN